MASDRKSVLSSIKQLIKDGSFQDALLQCKELLRSNPDSFEGNVYAGKCACELYLYEESERYYKSAHEHKPTALQPFHGLVQLYRRTGAHDKHADALRHVLANTTDKSAKYATRVELAKALIQSCRHDEAHVAILAIEDELREGCLSEGDFEVPEEVNILKADCQLALDEKEYNSRIQSTLATRRTLMSSGGEDKRDDDLLIQEVAATWAEEMLNRPDDAVSRMAQAASSAPHPRFTKYQIEMLKRVMATIQGAPAGSAERHERRVAAVHMCYDIVSRGGCTSTTPYELALRLLEVEEEVTACAGGTGTGVSFSLPAGVSKGVAGMGGASAAGGSMSRSISIQQAAANAVAAVSNAAAPSAPLQPPPVAPPDAHPQPPLPPPVQVPHQALEVSRPSLTPVATAPPLAHMSSVTSQTMPSSATAAAAAAAPGASNLDLLLSGMPLAGAGGSQADADGSTLPHTPARRSSSGLTPSGSRSGPPGRKGGPSFGPTNIDLDDIDTPPSSQAPSEAGAPEDAKTDLPADDAAHVGDVGMHGPSDTVSIPNSRMLANAPRGSMVRFASRQTSEFGEPEVIPVMGSYELRSLSRMHDGAVSAALASATGAATAARAVSGSLVASTASDMPVADAQPRGPHASESPLRADCQSSVGPGGSAVGGLGGHAMGGIPRGRSYASLDAFGGHLSLGSVAGSEEMAPPRAALPPLSALPRISREDSASMLNGTYTPSHAGTAASGTLGGHVPASVSFAAGAGGGVSFVGGRSPSRMVSMSHAPSLTSRVSESAQGSFFAGNRYVPPADEEVCVVRQVGVLEDMERFAARLVHLSPTSDVGQAHLAMAVQRRAAELEQTAPQLQRPRVIAALREPLTRGAPTAAGWLCLAGLYRKDGNHSEALWAARMGLQHISTRVRASGEKMTQAGLALRLEAAQALLALERLDEAVDAFSLLKEWTSDGEITFPYVAGIMPTSVRQQAARGLAQVEVRRGNRRAAKKQYEKLLGKALRGYGPSEHWAHAEYAWLLYEDGLREQALHHLQAAIDVSGLGDIAVDPAEVASYHYRLGRVLWETKAKGEEGARDAANAYEAFLHAASMDGPAQAPSFACLGHYFRDKGEEMKARKCYQRALELDCLQAGAGLALCELLHESNSEDIVKGICEEMLEAEPGAVWARLRLGLHHQWLGRPQEAISELQAALRMDPSNAEAWEALGAAYESVGRLQAALKVYERAVELDDRRVFALTQAAAISSLTGNTDGALALLDRALAQEPRNPAVLMCQCQTHSQIATLYKSLGALTLAAGSLRKAADAAARSARINGTLETTWKSLGDCRIAQARLPTPSQPPLQNLLDASPGSSEAAENNSSALIKAYDERKVVARSAQRAYAAAVHLNPLRPASWSDLALTQHQRVMLSAAHSTVCDTPMDTEALCATAERVLMAALRLAPDVPGLWSALGSVETAPAKREYALRRALQLDPSDALTWLKLGRLYHAHSLQGKATACFDAARSCDPKLPAIWEAMAATEATHDPYATPSSSAATQAFGLSKHALQLRGGPEAALGFLWSALRDADVAAWGTTRAAAHCAASAQPLNAAAYHALGLVMESSGAFCKAACVLRTALVLLKRNADAAVDDADMAKTEALMKLSGRAKGAGPALIAPVQCMSVQKCLELDLARVLAKAGSYQESVQLYASILESSGAMEDSTGMDAYAWLAYARASAAAKNADAAATGQSVSAGSDGLFEPLLLDKAAAAADTLSATAHVAAASVATLALSQNAPFAQVREHAQNVDGTMRHAQQQALGEPPSTQAAVHQAELQARLSVLTAATLRATDAEFREAEDTCRSALLRMRMHVTPSDDVPSGAATMHAEAVADTHVARAARAVRESQHAQACCAAARAVHVCPWSAAHRDVAACIAASNEKQPQHASRIAAQHAAGTPQQLESALMHGGAAATAHLVGGVAGLPPAGGISVTTRGALAAAIKTARVRVLQCPTDPHAWGSLAHMLTQQAALSRAGDDARSATRACMQSLHVMRTAPSTTGANNVLVAHALVLQSIAQSVVAEGCASGGTNVNESPQRELHTPESHALSCGQRTGAPTAATGSPATPARSPPFTRGVTRMPTTSTNGGSGDYRVTAQNALTTAQQALQAVEGLGPVDGSDKGHMHALKGASLRQLARCHRLLGDTNATLAALQQGKNLGDPCCSILLAKQLWASGGTSEASGILSEASRTLSDPPASEACAEWLGAVHVSQVELACMAGDMQMAARGLHACAAAGTRPAGVATALVATAACMNASARLKTHGMSPEARQDLFHAQGHAVKAFEACHGADVVTVGASTIAEVSDLLGNVQSAKLAHDVANRGYRKLKDSKRRQPAYMHIEPDTGEESDAGGLPKVTIRVTSPVSKGQGVGDAGMKNLSHVVVRLAGSKASES